MALYLGGKKVAGNTTSELSNNDLKNFTVTFDDSGIIEESEDFTSIMSNIKSNGLISSIVCNIKKCLNYLNNKINVIDTNLKIKNIEYGSMTFTNVPNGSSAPWVTKQIIFETQFENSPYVIIIPQMAAWMYLHQVGNITETGCTIRVRNIDSTGGASIEIKYIVIDFLN